ncbi:MAG TPA: serpin family protein [Candidatus Limnocylindrales bacterium]
MKTAQGLAALVLVGAIVSGCTGQAAAGAEATSAASRAPVAAGDASKAAGDMNAFGFDFYKAALTSGDNAVVSPASILLALSMARVGAAGQTASQMNTVLHSPSPSALNSLDQALAGLSGTFKDQESKDYEVTLRIANAPFAQRDYKFVQAFLDTLASQYGAGIRLVDFKADSAGAVRDINKWVSDKTEARIPELLDKLDPATRLVLVNAIYMKAPWLAPFPESATEPAPFTRLDGSKVSVPTMKETVHDGLYASGSDWQAVELPYMGGSLAMTIVVPQDLAAFEKTLSATRFAEITDALHQTYLSLSLPRFKAETKSELSAALATMGMPLAFDPNKADFSGITTQEPLHISKVVHQANISVDEKGTEASAATAVVMMAGAAPGPQQEPMVVHVDRPFIFAVRDTKTGAILFLGRVVDPSI